MLTVIKLPFSHENVMIKSLDINYSSWGGHDVWDKLGVFDLLLVWTKAVGVPVRWCFSTWFICRINLNFLVVFINYLSPGGCVACFLVGWMVWQPDYTILVIFKVPVKFTVSALVQTKSSRITHVTCTRPALLPVGTSHKLTLELKVFKWR